MTDTPPPGSDAAIKAGCICPVLDNRHGWGYWAQGVYIYTLGCSVHSNITLEETSATVPESVEWGTNYPELRESNDRAS